MAEENIKDPRDLNDDGKVSFEEKVKYAAKEVKEEAKKLYDKAAPKAKEFLAEVKEKSEDLAGKAKEKFESLKEKKEEDKKDA